MNVELLTASSLTWTSNNKHKTQQEWRDLRLVSALSLQRGYIWYGPTGCIYCHSNQLGPVSHCPGHQAYWSLNSLCSSGTLYLLSFHWLNIFFILLVEPLKWIMKWNDGAYTWHYDFTVLFWPDLPDLIHQPHIDITEWALHTAEREGDWGPQWVHLLTVVLTNDADHLNSVFSCWWSGSLCDLKMILRFQWTLFKLFG